MLANHRYYFIVLYCIVLQMKMMMSGGQAELEQEMANDPETYECVTKLNEIMGRIGLGG